MKSNEEIEENRDEAPLAAGSDEVQEQDLPADENEPAEDTELEAKADIAEFDESESADDQVVQEDVADSEYDLPAESQTGIDIDDEAWEDPEGGDVDVESQNQQAIEDAPSSADAIELEQADENDTEAAVEFEGDRPLVKELVYQAPRGNPSKEELEESEALKFTSVSEAKSVVEGFLFSCNEPLTVSKLSKLMNNLHPKTVRGLLLELQWEYENRPGALQVIEIAGGYQMSTRAHVAPWMFRMHKHKRRSALSPATLETLAIVAYRQPITKGEIETIRGVESGAPLRTLQDLNLVEASGRREVIGRPQLYITTEQFLKTFGLKSVADLPSISELKNRFAEEQKIKRVVSETPKPEESTLEEVTEVSESPADADIEATLEETQTDTEVDATESDNADSESADDSVDFKVLDDVDDLDDLSDPESDVEDNITDDDPDIDPVGVDDKKKKAHQAFLDEQSMDEA